MKKIVNLILLLVLLLSGLITKTVYAREDILETGAGNYTPKYISDIYFRSNITKDGRELYCINHEKASVTNMVIYYEGVESENIGYLLSEGYPYKNFTGDATKDKYITQTALWWYLDEVRNTNTLGQDFKSGQDPYGLRKYIVDLKEKAKKYDTTDAVLSLETTSKELKLVNDNYETEVIKVNHKKVQNIEVEADGKVEVLSKDTNGNILTFKVIVPKDKVTPTYKLKVTVKGKTTKYIANKYTTKKAEFQNVILLETSTVSLNSSLDFNTKQTTIIIKKIATDTGEMLPGAKLRLLDENGQTIKEWTTTSNAYVISDLKVGKYTLEEISAPNGYSLNTNKQIIEVKNNGETLNIEFQNAKTVIVPNTNVNSKIITIIGTLLLIISLGTGLAYKNAKSK